MWDTGDSWRTREAKFKYVRVRGKFEAAEHVEFERYSPSAAFAPGASFRPTSGVTLIASTCRLVTSEEDPETLHVCGDDATVYTYKDAPPRTAAKPLRLDQCDYESVMTREWSGLPPPAQSTGYKGFEPPGLAPPPERPPPAYTPTKKDPPAYSEPPPLALPPPPPTLVDLGLEPPFGPPMVATVPPLPSMMLARQLCYVVTEAEERTLVRGVMGQANPELASTEVDRAFAAYLALAASVGSFSVIGLGGVRANVSRRVGKEGSVTVSFMGWVYGW